MPTCFLVVGQPRSGTSLVAGLLHRAGIDMGQRSKPPSAMNPVGFFLDLDFEELLADEFHFRQLPGEMSPKLRDRIRGLIVEREKAGRDWGVKSLWGPVLWPHLIELCGAVRVIRTTRPKERSRASLASHTKYDAETIRRVVDWADTQANRIESEAGALRLDYDAVHDDTMTQLSRLATFAGRNSIVTDTGFIDPTLRRF